MPYLIEFILFLLPFAAYALWRRLEPRTEPGPAVVLLAALGVVLVLAGAVWYGLSRSMDRGAVYVPPHLEGEVVIPAQSEPHR